MKKVILGISILMLTGQGVTMAETSGVAKIDKSLKKCDDKKTESFKVWGNCGMCESTIEGAFKEVESVEKADWDKDTKMIEVTYSPHSITLDEIKKKIADVGYDTKEYRATEEVYNNLPGCCQYERPIN